MSRFDTMTEAQAHQHFEDIIGGAQKAFRLHDRMVESEAIYAQSTRRIAITYAQSCFTEKFPTKLAYLRHVAASAGFDPAHADAWLELQSHDSRRCS